jgi:hypothetical protein
MGGPTGELKKAGDKIRYLKPPFAGYPERENLADG